MREILSIHIGQAGVRKGAALWELYCLEHGVKHDGTIDNPIESKMYEGFSSFFSQTLRETYVPISLMVDSDAKTLDGVKQGPLRDLFNPDNLINGSENSANSFVRGYVNLGKEVIDKVMGSIDKIVDDCDSFQGFVLFNAAGGGAGSGFGALLMEELSENFGKKEKVQFCIFPSPEQGASVVEPYNAVLSTHFSLENSNCTFLVDNQAMYRIFRELIEVNGPTYPSINGLLSEAYSAITANFRFDGSVCSNLNELQTSLIPFPRLQFPIISYAPIWSRRLAMKKSNTVRDITRSCFDYHNQMLSCEPNYDYHSKYLASCILYRGDVQPKDINKVIMQVKLKKEFQFNSMSLTGFQIGINLSTPKVLKKCEIGHSDKTACLIVNSTSIRKMFLKIFSKFNLMYKKKAFLHWFEKEQLWRENFKQAKENLESLLWEYEEMEKLF